MSLGAWADGIAYAPSEAAYWQGQSILTGAVVGAAPDDNQIQRSACQMVFERTTPSGVTDDVAVVTWNFLKETISFGTSILSGTEKAAAEGWLDTLWTDHKAQVSAHWTLREYRWHDYLTSWTKPGPATRVTTKGVVATGSATNTLPDQVASSYTFITSSRKHWGRVYFLPFVATAYGSTGRLTTAQTDSRSAAVRALINSASSAGTPLIVPSTSHRAVLAISKLQMDNTPDVIRSRRAKHPEYRKSYTS